MRARTLDDLLSATGLTHSAISKRCRVHRFVLYRLRRGMFRTARRPTIAKIAKALGVFDIVVERAILASWRDARRVGDPVA